MRHRTEVLLLVEALDQAVVHLGTQLVLRLLVAVLPVHGMDLDLLLIVGAEVQILLHLVGLQSLVQALGTRLAAVAVRAIQMVLQHLLETNIAAVVVQVVTVAS